MISETGLVLPDFLIGGAARSGTTWLRHTLKLHPEIYMASPWPPEPQFFYIEDRYEKGIEAYSKEWFSGASHEVVLGEKSTAYLESPGVAERIHEHLPAAKMIFILREPIDRAFNNYLWSKTNGIEKADFLTAIELELKGGREKELPEKYKWARPYVYYERGLYDDLLAKYYDLFPAENILCLKFEDIAEDPKTLIADVHEFLGVTIRTEDAAEVGVVNKAEAEDKEVIPDEARTLLEDLYEEPNRRLVKRLGPKFEW